MKKIIILIMMLLIFPIISLADIYSDLSYYYNLNYPNITNLVNVSQLGIWNDGESVSGIIDTATKFNSGTWFKLMQNLTITQNPFSVSAWLNTNNTGKGIFFGKHGVAWGYEYDWDKTKANEIGFSYSDYYPSTRICRLASTDINIADTNWHNVVIVKLDNLCLNNSFNLYLDGIKHDFFTFSSLYAQSMNNTIYFDNRTSNWTIGTDYSSSWTFVDGFIDEVGIWNNYELNQSDVDFLYNNGSGQKLCTPDWNCNGYNTCMINNTQNCNSVVDNNSCGESYSGDYSEFTPQSCVYPVSPSQLTFNPVLALFYVVCIMSLGTLFIMYRFTILKNGDISMVEFVIECCLIMLGILIVSILLL